MGTIQQLLQVLAGRGDEEGEKVENVPESSTAAHVAVSVDATTKEEVAEGTQATVEEEIVGGSIEKDGPQNAGEQDMKENADGVMKAEDEKVQMLVEMEEEKGETESVHVLPPVGPGRHMKHTNKVPKISHHWK